MDLSEYTSHDAVGLADLVRTKAVTAAELVDVANSALDAVNPALNAVIGRIDPPVDSELARLSGAFAGVPFLLKDLGHGWAGIQCDMGSRLTQGYVETDDSSLAQRLRSSGLVPVGRTNTPEFGVNATTEPVLHGPTNNPWDPARSPGGSSGGSAAAVAAGVVPMAHATDGGGSIRMPAAWCGLVGLKPSRGRNPLGPDAADPSHSIVAAHVISRTVRDTAAALDVSSGPAKGDFIPLSRPEQKFLRAAATPPQKLRIALCTKLKDAPEPEGPCVEAAIDAARLCESLGHEVVETRPGIPYPHISALCFDLYTATAVSRIERLSRVMGRSATSKTLEPQTLAMLTKGRVMTALDVVQAFDHQNAMSRAMGLFMDEYDVFLTPAVSRVPCMTGEFRLSEYEKNDLGYWEREMACYTFLPLASITGQPAMSLPLYWTVSGLPVGVQISAAIGNDATLLQLAGQLEEARPWSGRKPSIHAAQG